MFFYNTTEVGFTVRDDGTNKLKVYYDATNEQLVVDKSLSGSSYITTTSMPMSKLDTEVADDMIFNVNVDAEINVKDLVRFKKYFVGLKLKNLDILNINLSGKKLFDSKVIA